MRIKTSNLLESVVDDLRALDFVHWDRFAEAKDSLTIYGGIPREDGRADFAVLLVNERGVGYITSSAERTGEIGKRLSGGRKSTGHQRCKRLEHYVPADLPNVIRKAAQQQKLEAGARVRRHHVTPEGRTVADVAAMRESKSVQKIFEQAGEIVRQTDRNRRKESE